MINPSDFTSESEYSQSTVPDEELKDVVILKSVARDSYKLKEKISSEYLSVQKYYSDTKKILIPLKIIVLRQESHEIATVEEEKKKKALSNWMKTDNDSVTTSMISSEAESELSLSGKADGANLKKIYLQKNDCYKNEITDLQMKIKELQERIKKNEKKAYCMITSIYRGKLALREEKAHEEK